MEQFSEADMYRSLTGTCSGVKHRQSAQSLPRVFAVTLRRSGKFSDYEGNNVLHLPQPLPCGESPRSQALKAHIKRSGGHGTAEITELGQEFDTSSTPLLLMPIHVPEQNESSNEDSSTIRLCRIPASSNQIESVSPVNSPFILTPQVPMTANTTQISSHLSLAFAASAQTVGCYM
jgi:hypothetical protein